MASEWFSVCDEGVFELHGTEAAAKAAAQTALDAVRDIAAEFGGEWIEEDVGRIRWGRVIGRAVEVPVIGEPDAADYELREVTDVR
jgi:hypothetical protein